MPQDNTTTQGDDVEQPAQKAVSTIKTWGTIAGLLVVAYATMQTLQIVPSGHVRTVSTFGDVADDELRPGLNMVFPIVQDTRQYSVQSQTYTMSGKEGEGDVTMRDDSIQALTEEGLNIDMDLSVRYHLKPEHADKVHRNIGTERQVESKVIRPTIRSAVRSSTSNFSVNSIYSDKRDELATSIKSSILEGLSSKGYKKAFVIEQVQVRNVMLPEKVREAIQEKEATQQQIEAKENAIKVERKEKERKIVEAEAISQSNKIIGQSLSQEYLKWYWIQNLDSHNSVMYVPSGQGGMPIMKDVDKVPSGSGNLTGNLSRGANMTELYEGMRQ